MYSSMKLSDLFNFEEKNKRIKPSKRKETSYDVLKINLPNVDQLNNKSKKLKNGNSETRSTKKINQCDKPKILKETKITKTIKETKSGRIITETKTVKEIKK